MNRVEAGWKSRVGLVALVAAALIHLLPAPGLLGADALRALYGLGELDPASTLLLRHRAWMFLLLGLFLLVALRVRAWLGPAIGMVLLSDLGFVAVCALEWPLTPAMQQVLVFDLVSILLLAAAVASGRVRLR